MAIIGSARRQRRRAAPVSSRDRSNGSDSATTAIHHLGTDPAPEAGADGPDLTRRDAAGDVESPQIDERGQDRHQEYVELGEQPHHPDHQRAGYQNRQKWSPPWQSVLETPPHHPVPRQQQEDLRE